MKDHQLGPNGAILTALNLFTAQPEKIISQIEATIATSPHERNIFVVDIPGQIEVFTWSSSSLILTQAISLLMPVKIVYILDSLRCQNPNVFLSNLLFARTRPNTQSPSSTASANTSSSSCSTSPTALTASDSASG
jgi:hypothetical protein